MLNKMPCSADKLNLLEPTMIQSVVEVSALKLGSQYLAEDRVRIDEADGVSITSVVIGYSGLYKQTMQLKDGTLITQCSCGLTEQPLCRHCVAVLLAYHRRGKPQPPEASPGKPMTEAPPEARQSATHAADISLRDLMAFVEWVQVAVSALERGHPLPESPKLGTTEVQGWIGSMQQLETRRREVEAERDALQMVLNARKVEISELTQQLQASVQDIKAAQSASQAMQRELTQYRVILGNLSDLAKELDRYKSQMRAIAADVEKQGLQLESLLSSVTGASAALQNLAELQRLTPPTS